MFDFKGKSAIVTGAGSFHGIGRETAVCLAECGCDVLIADLDLDGALRNAREIQEKNGINAIGVQVDVTDPTSVWKASEAALNAFGKIDILVNSAGITQPIRTIDMTVEQFKRMICVNLEGTFLMIKAVLPSMIKNHYGRIVSVSSVSAKRGGGVFGGSHYSASKAGIMGFSKNLAREVVTDCITVNSVCPGLIATDFRRSATGLSEDAERALWEDIPLKRPGTPREVAAAIVFLASEEAAFITGEEIDINGGAHID
jgi:3-oxoacyl-[acyl-carrier protein] reductase